MPRLKKKYEGKDHCGWKRKVSSEKQGRVKFKRGGSLMVKGKKKKNSYEGMKRS